MTNQIVDNTIYLEPIRQGFWARFWGFDRFISSGLIKSEYYSGILSRIIVAIFIVLVIMIAPLFFTPLQQAGYAVLLVQLLLAAIIFWSTIGGIVRWRVDCERRLIDFQSYNRLGQIRDILGQIGIAQSGLGLASANSPGAPVARPMVCGRCGAAMPIDARFCTDCGLAA